MYVLALRRAFDTAGLPTEQISHEFLLVCPKDFSNRPYGRLIDLRQELDALRFQLSRLRRAEDLAVRLPETATLDTTRSTNELSSAIEALDASYTPSCLSFCEMARYCRDEADGCASPARPGSAVRNDLPGSEGLRTARGELGERHVANDAHPRACQPRYPRWQRFSSGRD
ncbi:hypothetical protein [Streptomyces kebangsaanensis]|uniref:hypothetical protein n=1 Tax=Streptomyces kebangsaanensis TaxID=864058 RepID=UPI000ACFD0D0|nr:hypothetical protein [Streptomyces kebangsaanensis]